MDLRAALTDDDASGRNVLTTECLYAEPLALCIATVLGRAATLFRSHFLYLQNLDAGPRLAVPGLLSAVLLRLVLIDVDLLTFHVFEDLHPRRAAGEVHGVPVGREADRQLYRVPDLARDTVHNEFGVP